MLLSFNKNNIIITFSCPSSILLDYKISLFENKIHIYQLLFFYYNYKIS